MVIPAIFENESQKKNWEPRRAQILSLFEDYEYGRAPRTEFDKQGCVRMEHYELTDGLIKESYGIFFVKGQKYAGLKFGLTYKAGLRKPMPVIMHVDPFSMEPVMFALGRCDDILNFEYFPMRFLANRGYAAINVTVGDLSRDDVKTYMHGIMDLYPAEGSSGWSSISVWAWGMSRVLDFVCSNEMFDSSKVIVAGCSRAGKTALWCGATDRRFAGVFASVSGCCGAAMHRGKTGERISDITTVFPHWSCKEFKKFADKEDELPIDQHMLLSLIAPRPLYITSASEDSWADPPKEFESCVRAGEAYRALGKEGLSSEVFPEVDSPITGGDIAYHLRNGKHGCFMYDWSNVLPFFERKLKIKCL